MLRTPSWTCLPSSECFNSVSRVTSFILLSCHSFVRRNIGSERTDLFKAAALRGVRSLFPPQHNPYHAAFGANARDVRTFDRYSWTPSFLFPHPFKVRDPTWANVLSQ